MKNGSGSEEREDLIEQLYEFYVPPGQRPERLDVYLTHVIPHATRTKVQKAIEAQVVLVNGKPAKPSRKIQPGDYILCRIYKQPPIELIPEPIPLEIVYEDEDILVINKPAGLVTHPGIGHRRGTLVNAVLYHLGMREAQPIEIDSEKEEYIFASPQIRPGIVHRLDKDTSGLLLVSKSARFHQSLALQFQKKIAKRFYYALVWGKIQQDSGMINAAIGRSPRDRKKFAVVDPEKGKDSITLYQCVKTCDIASFLDVELKTGRTHQIRVHMASIGHPVIGDSLYGGDKIPRKIPSSLHLVAQQVLQCFNRQALHAYRLRFVHPRTKEPIELEAPLPEDFQTALQLLASQFNE